jgi:hypothetical protein
MQIDINQIVSIAVEKAKENLQFAEDLMKYVQYLTIKSCPQDKIPNLKQILEIGNMKELLEFGAKLSSNYNKQIAEYIIKY